MVPIISFDILIIIEYMTVVVIFNQFLWVIINSDWLFVIKYQGLMLNVVGDYIFKQLTEETNFFICSKIYGEKIEYSKSKQKDVLSRI